MWIFYLERIERGTIVCKSWTKQSLLLLWLTHRQILVQLARTMGQAMQGARLLNEFLGNRWFVTTNGLKYIYYFRLITSIRFHGIEDSCRVSNLKSAWVTNFYWIVTFINQTKKNLVSWTTENSCVIMFKAKTWQNPHILSLIYYHLLEIVVP